MSYDEVACLMDDEGFGLTFSNDIAGGALHTRWYLQSNERKLIDIWFGSSGITIWNHSGKSIKGATEEDIINSIKNI